MERTLLAIACAVCAVLLAPTPAPIVDQTPPARTPDYAADMARLERDLGILHERCQQQPVAHDAPAPAVSKTLASRLESSPPVVTPATLPEPPAGGVARQPPAPASRQPMQYGYCVGPGCSAGSAYTHRTSRNAGPIRRLLGRR